MTDLTALTEITTLLSPDIAYTVNLPGSSKNPRQVTWANVLVLFSTLSETITGTKTFGAVGDVSKLIIAGTTSGTTILNATAVAGSGTVILPTTGTLSTLTGSETLTNKTLTSPTLTTPALGTPVSGVLTNVTGLPLTTGVTGILPSINMDSDTAHLSVVQIFTGKKTFGTIGGTVDKFALAGSTSGSTILNATAVAGSGTVILPTTGTLSTIAGSETLTNKTLTSPILTTPALGTPVSGVMTNVTGLPLTTGVTGTLPVANGGTGVTTSTGTGNTVLSASPSLTGTVALPIVTVSGNMTHSGRNQEDKGADVVSASEITLGGDGNFFDITGTTTINTILATNWQNGSRITLQFDSALTVTHNSGGTNDILLADDIDFLTEAGDVLTLVLEGTDWIESSRNSGDGVGMALATEENSTPVTDTTEGNVVTNRQYADSFLVGSDFEFYIITGVEWKNGATVAGSIQSGVDIIDASPPVNDTVKTIANSEEVVQAGSDLSLQRPTLIHSDLIPKGTRVAGWILGDSSSMRVRQIADSSANRAKAMTFATGLVGTLDYTAWSTATAHIYVKVYFKGVGKKIT